MIIKPIIPIFISTAICIIILGIASYIIIRRSDIIMHKVISLIRIFLIISLTFVITLRPMREDINFNIQTNNLDVLFVVDTTMSMWAEDYGSKDPRMEGVIKNCEYIIDRLDGSSFALIRFDNKSQVLSPFTQDSRSVKDALSTITMPSEYYANGSNFDVPIADMISMAESSSKKDGKMLIVFFISDGEITTDSELPSFEELEKYTKGGAVLGYGTSSGGKMRVGNDYIQEFDEEGNSSDALSKIDESNLKSIASDIDISYMHVTQTRDIEDVASSIMSGASVNIEKNSTGQKYYTDIYYYFAALLVPLLLWEMYVIIRKGRF